MKVQVNIIWDKDNDYRLTSTQEWAVSKRGTTTYDLLIKSTLRASNVPALLAYMVRGILHGAYE